VRSTTGLYHFALEYPSRRELARSLGCSPCIIAITRPIMW
jgi:hypothetical protein